MRTIYCHENKKKDDEEEAERKKEVCTVHTAHAKL